ncbi:MAG: diacylglycerol kinase family protein [Anaerolineales bacterium]|nr:diacylglycerol kinase family protein [Anaerolineales bacterium]
MDKNRYLRSRLRSIGVALEGIKYVLITQQNARIHAVFTLAVFLVGWLFQLNRLEWICLLLTVSLVWMAEIFNTAVEKTVDVISPGQHTDAKIIKDISAGAVLVSVLVAILVGILIFGPHLWFWLLRLVSS